jgi:hypothetical protein
MSEFKNLEYCKRQIQLSMLRAQWWIASAQTGHYKQRKIFHGTETSGGNEFTDEEKLENCMLTALRHIEIAAEFNDNLAEAESDAHELQQRAMDYRRPDPVR